MFEEIRVNRFSLTHSQDPPPRRSKPSTTGRSMHIVVPCGLEQKDFPALLDVTRDERFVTARHCIQAIWKVGLAGETQKAQLIDGLKTRYFECIDEKNCTLIRFDIIEALCKLYDAVHDEAIKVTALEWIEQEDDLKYRKKYVKVWK